MVEYESIFLIGNACPVIWFCDVTDDFRGVVSEWSCDERPELREFLELWREYVVSCRDDVVSCRDDAVSCNDFRGVRRGSADACLASSLSSADSS